MCVSKYHLTVLCLQMFWLGNPYTTGVCYPQPSDMDPTQPFFLPQSQQNGRENRKSWSEKSMGQDRDSLTGEGKGTKNKRTNKTQTDNKWYKGKRCNYLPQADPYPASKKQPPWKKTFLHVFCTIIAHYDTQTRTVVVMDWTNINTCYMARNISLGHSAQQSWLCHFPASHPSQPSCCMGGHGGKVK